MSALFVLARLRVLDVFRSRASGALFLLLPTILLFVIGFVFANGQPFERRTVLVVTPAENDVAMVHAADPTLRVEREERLDAAMGKLRAHTISAIFVRKSDEPVPRIVSGPNERLFAEGLRWSLKLQLEIPVVTVPLPPWGYVHYLFPGLLASATLLAGLYGMGYAMVRYRESRFLKKLATTPLTRTTFIAANVLSRVVLVLVQMAVLFVAALLVFHLPMTPIAAAWTLVLTVLGLIVFTGTGFFLACIIRTEALIIDVINAITMPVVLVSGIFFPVDALPAPLAAIGRVLPTTILVDAVRSVLLYGETRASALAVPIAWLLAWAAIVYAASLVAFKWHRE